MRSLILLWLLLAGAQTLYAQLPPLSDTDFEVAVLAYEPESREEVPDKNLDFARMVLRETRSSTEGKSANFNRADYLNVLFVFLKLRESSDNLSLALEKFIATDVDCEYLHFFAEKVNSSDTYAPIRKRWSEALSGCGKYEAVKIDPQAYALENDFDPALVRLMATVLESDQRYRSPEDAGGEDQRLLDARNLQIIDSLFQLYGYVGRDLVGKEFESSMWAVVQHSNIGAMKRYLPAVNTAAKQGQLSVTCLKMLLDRIHTADFGWQIFGSQGGVPLGDDEQCAAVRAKYHLK